MRQKTPENARKSRNDGVMDVCAASLVGGNLLECQILVGAFTFYQG